MASHDVFISYPSADKASAAAVCHGLEARGVRCWMAPRDVTPGLGWQTALLDAIAEAPVMVLLFTAATNASDHIAREVTAASESGSVVIPFRLQNVTPTGALRYQLTGVHWLDAFDGKMDENVDQLATTVKRVLERADSPPADPDAPPPPVRPFPAAPEAPAPAFNPPPPTPAPARSGGVPSWAWLAGGGVLLLVIGAFAVGGLMARGGGPAPAPATPVATAPPQNPIAPVTGPAQPIPTPAIAPPTGPAPGDLVVPPGVNTPASASRGVIEPPVAPADPVEAVLGTWRGDSSVGAISMTLSRTTGSLTINDQSDSGPITYRPLPDGSIEITDDQGETGVIRLTGPDTLSLRQSGVTLRFQRVG